MPSGSSGMAPSSNRLAQADEEVGEGSAPRLNRNVHTSFPAPQVTSKDADRQRVQHQRRREREQTMEQNKKQRTVASEQGINFTYYAEVRRELPINQPTITTYTSSSQRGVPALFDPKRFDYIACRGNGVLGRPVGLQFSAVGASRGVAAIAVAQALAPIGSGRPGGHAGAPGDVGAGPSSARGQVGSGGVSQLPAQTPPAARTPLQLG